MKKLKQPEPTKWERKKTTWYRLNAALATTDAINDILAILDAARISKRSREDVDRLVEEIQAHFDGNPGFHGMFRLMETHYVDALTKRVNESAVVYEKLSQSAKLFRGKVRRKR